MGRISNLLPARLRRTLLALAEIGDGRNGDLRLALVAPRRSLFLDVGANRGQYARFVAFLFDRGLVFEPLEAFGTELRAVLPSGCRVHHCALADFDGPATFHIPIDGDLLDTQTASLVMPADRATHRAVTVPVKRLDDFGLDGVSFIKVDVEGAEYAFLQGALATIERCRPVMLIEIEDRHTEGRTRRVFDLLADLGYDAFLPRDAQEPHRRRPVAMRILHGAALAAGLIKVDLQPVAGRLSEIHAGSLALNTAFGPRYTNNFLFVPRAGSATDPDPAPEIRPPGFKPAAAGRNRSP